MLHSMSSSEEDEDTVSLASSVAELSQGKVMCLPAKPITTVVWPDVMQKSSSIYMCSLKTSPVDLTRELCWLQKTLMVLMDFV